MTVLTHNPFTATVLGLPRVGPRRELKRATESYWAGRIDAARLHEVARELRRAQYTELLDAGMDSIPVGTFSYYDQMLDTAVLLGALPPRVAGIEAPLNRYFAAARGTDAVEPLEMTKWFDTNYHYLVPELGPQTTFTLHPETVLDQLGEAIELGVPARPVIIGPVTFLKLAKTAGAAALERIDELVPLYRELLSLLAGAGAHWVQIDEPVLVTDLTEDELAVVRRVYTELTASGDRPAMLVATYFGTPGPALAALAGTDVEGLAVDLVSGTELGELAAVPALANKLLVAGVVDGRNVWRTDLDAALSTLGTLLGCAKSVAVSTSCSLLHVPYSLAVETGLDDALRSWLAFGAEKVGEVRVLATGLSAGTATIADELSAARAASASRAADPRISNGQVRARLAALGPDAVRRAPPNSAGSCNANGSSCRCCPPPPSARIRRLRRFGRPAPRCVRARSTAPPTSSGCATRSPTSSPCRRSWSSMCWCTASRNAMTWCSISPSSSTDSRRQSWVGCSPTAPVASGRRSCSVMWCVPRR